jgi:hypothetical protein
MTDRERKHSGCKGNKVKIQVSICGIGGNSYWTGEWGGISVHSFFDPNVAITFVTIITVY